MLYEVITELDMQGIYDVVGDKIRDVFDAQIVTVITSYSIHYTKLYDDVYFF